VTSGCESAISSLHLRPEPAEYARGVRQPPESEVVPEAALAGPHERSTRCAQVVTLDPHERASAISRCILQLTDVSAEADFDSYVCANGTCTNNWGGTSLAAPRWAGFLALVNQQANGTPVGFLNPSLYALGQGVSYSSVLHDIVVGNNFNDGSPDLFSAVRSGGPRRRHQGSRVRAGFWRDFRDRTGNDLLTAVAYPFEGELEDVQQRLWGQNLRSIRLLVVEGQHLSRHFEGEKRRGLEAGLAEGPGVGADA
jgi:hypothetical protein